jgi:hypothetical protein
VVGDADRVAAALRAQARDHLLVPKARVGAQQDLPGRAGLPDPREQFVDEAQRAALRVRRPFPEPDVQDLSGVGARRESSSKTTLDRSDTSCTMQVTSWCRPPSPESTASCLLRRSFHFEARTDQPGETVDRGLALVVLDDVGGALGGVVGVAARLAQRAALAQQVPEAVELDAHGLQALVLLGREAALVPAEVQEPVLLGDQLLDVVGNGLVRRHEPMIRRSQP